MQHSFLARALSRIEAVSLLEKLGRSRELDRLLDHLEAWADELADLGIGITHSLKQRDGALMLEMDLSGGGRTWCCSSQLDSIDCVYIVRERVRDYHALSAGALMPVLRERLRDWLGGASQAGALARAG